MKVARFLAILALGALGAAFVVGVSLAGDQDKKAEYNEQEMKAWMEAMAPGEHHKHFAKLEGEWNAAVTTWQAPGIDPVKAEGKSTYKVILGGRYLMQDFKGAMMGMPFEGIGISGFDKVAGKHTAVWIDNFGTQTMYSEGMCSDHCMKETHETTMKSPMTGEDMKIKMITTIIDDNKHVFEYYMPAPDGSMFKTMEIVYTRA